MNGDSYSSRDGGRHGSSRDYPSSRRDRDDRRDRDRRDRGDRDRGGERRRRSRSPAYRDRGSNRRGGAPGDDAEADAYSASRSHREREREDRYSSGRGGDRGGPRGGEREWDRDRGSGRSRRDDDHMGGDRRRGGGGRDSHRDGGGFGDDRRRRGDRGGGGGGRGGDAADHEERDLFEQNRRRSASPPPKKREPTPDLTDVVPVTERKRRLTQWDIKPPGYEAVTAEQAKLSGMFPLPGAPRQQAMDPTKLQAFMSSTGAGGDKGAASGATLKPTNSRQSKRLVVSNLPPSTTEAALVDFFNLQLNGLNVIESTDPCVLAQLAGDRTFAMVEFRTGADATLALALDGIKMEADDHNGDVKMEDGSGANGNGHVAGQGLKIRRPKDYIVPAVVEEPSNYDPDSDAPLPHVVDSPHKISVTNLPPYLTDDQCIELLVSFGKLKRFVLVKDNGTQESRGIAFAEYVDHAATDVAISGLNGMNLGEHVLKVQKASIGITQVSGMEMGVNAMSMLAGTTAVDPDVNRVLQLLNMVTPEELMDNEDYEEIKEDVEEECAKYGSIAAIKIPRPVGGSRQSPGVGKIYVKYDTPEAAKKAMQALAGRKFADRTVVVTYFPEENFDVGAW